ncbi:MAG: hypothetical protein ACREJX_19265, partial [Polyangiaceae bacterium]
AFEKAYAIYPHPSILLNLGIVCLRTGDYVNAEDDLSRFLVNDGGATPDELASGREALAESRGHLGTMRLKISPAFANVLLDGKPVAIVQGGTTELRTTTGLHDVRISADDYDADEEHIMVTSDKVAERAVMLTPHARESGNGDNGAVPTKHGMSTQALLGWGLVGFAGVAIFGGAVCGIRAISLADDYNDERPQDPSDRSTGIAFRTAADVLFATAIVSGGVGAYFILTAPKSSAPSASVIAGPRELQLRVAF